MRVKITEIKIVDRKRKLKPEAVADLAESIKNFGLLNPITISKDFRLIAGLHRLEAAKSVGWDEISANVMDLSVLDAELAELDENLIRYELHYIERGEHLKRRKEIYELKYPETKHGGDRKSEEAMSKRHDGALTSSFSEDTASKTHLSQRTIQREIQIASDLAPEVKKLVIEKNISKTDALTLARQPSDKQKQTLETLISEDKTDKNKKTRKETRKNKDDSESNLKSAQGRSEYLKYKNGEKISPDQALKAKCYECMYFYSDGTINCEVPDCPLYLYMPYNPDRIQDTN